MAGSDASAASQPLVGLPSQLPNPPEHWNEQEPAVHRVRRARVGSGQTLVQEPQFLVSALVLVHTPAQI